MSGNLTKASETSRRPRGWGRAAAAAFFLTPGLIALIVLAIVPMILMLTYMFFPRGRFGGVVYEFTLENFERLSDPLYLGVIGDSFVIAGTVTLLALLIGYPAAYAIAQLPPRWKTIALLAIMLPFWTNFLIRIYAWIVLLSGPGLVNGALTGIGLIDEPLDLLYNEGTIVLGLLYGYLSLMILPIYSAVEKLDPRLREASANLGASPARTFFSVTLPLTLPSALIGAVLVFVPSFGNYVVPELLGGGKAIMLGNMIRDQFLKARDWPFGATLSLVMIVITFILLIAQAVASRRVRNA
ncbi:spermidine/putrescine ABC transporter permease [Acrocarpospora phusangensis]|uniref:Spermidine/putrescine ABC transporter permease n=1 Tax=Acrocarpospora phusangensis TaxID=1070424 RepID=A0A919QA98_9ACTN|nr:ABC transporter permease [Acrocarpospora phusangensis]GIH24336.1 spermidine/putrescine ABC transporter permease [Acrocarpospora phusangensis]